MKFILIMTMIWANGSIHGSSTVATAEFNTEFQCERAATAWHEQVAGITGRATTICVEK